MKHLHQVTVFVVAVIFHRKKMCCLCVVCVHVCGCMCYVHTCEVCACVVFNKNSPSLGGMVVKEIIRPSLSTTQQQIKPPKKRPKQSSTNILQEPKSLKSNSKVLPAKQKEPKHQKLDPKQHAEDRNLEVAEDNTKKTVALVPVSPRKKEPWGSTLLKVCTYLEHN